MHSSRPGQDTDISILTAAERLTGREILFVAESLTGSGRLTGSESLTGLTLTFRVILQLLLVFLMVSPACAKSQTDTTTLALNQKQTVNFENEKRAYQICLKGAQLNLAGDFAQAKQTLGAGAALDPTSYSGYLHKQLAQSCMGLKDYQGAAGEIKLAMKYTPEDESLGYQLAIVLNNAGDSEKSQAALTDFISRAKNPKLKADATRQLKQMGAFSNLKAATKALDSNNLTEAHRLLARAASYDPSSYSADVHGNLCYVLQRLGQSEKAISEGQEALKLNPDEKTTVYSIGLAYQDIGKFDDAISWLKRYAKMETDPAERKKAENFISELADDRGKQDMSTVDKPDYFDQLRKKGPIESWPKSALPLKVYVNTQSGTRGYRPVFKSFVVRAFDTWSNITGKITYRLVNERSAADIVVTFTSAPLTMDENNRARQKAGLTYVTSDDNGTIKSADVQISTVNPFNDNAPVQDGECAATCMHEIGHSLGLGHSPCVSDIMYFGSSSKQTGLPSARDKATVARMYQALPVVANLPAVKTPVPIKYLPPPAFMPPKPPDTTDLRPPLFLPPPLPKEIEKLRPPVFLPPPLTGDRPIRGPTDSGGSAKAGSRPSLPFFVPPPKDR